MRFGQSVKNTGDVTASENSIAVSGFVAGDLNLNVLPIPRSRYLDQVNLIAPPEGLIGRADEIKLMGEFCTAEHVPNPYMRWRAGPWTGKTALMSWFVLHPPANVRIVSFFITARFAGQSDWVAFTDILMEQLAELLNQPLPALLTDATRVGHLTGALADAASWCRDRKQRLVLVVDGLDEDRGVTAFEGANSIAGLLPSQPPAGMRIILSGRPDPPIPDDVPDHHPLRSGASIHQLTSSFAASTMRAAAEAELKRLLARDWSRELLGFVAAAGGGLTCADLSELTTQPRYRIEYELNSVTGRTFRGRAPRMRQDEPELLYVLAHEELQQAAEKRLAGELVKYRKRLASWADRYHSASWPVDTPEYLLGGYFNLLRSVHDQHRMVAYATDSLRHGRMLELTGGDTAALAEVSAAQQAIVGASANDLVALAKLNFHQVEIVDRNTAIPTKLPAVWMLLGNRNRALALAHAISDQSNRIQALAGVAEAAAAGATADIALEMLAEAGTLVRGIMDLSERGRGLRVIAQAAASCGLVGHAHETIREISNVDIRAHGLVQIAILLAPRDSPLALKLADEALKLDEGISVPYNAPRYDLRASALEVLAVVGELTRARDLAQKLANAASRARVTSRVVEVLFSRGEIEDARTLSRDITEMAHRETNPHYQAEALMYAVRAAGAVGFFSEGRLLAGAISNPNWRVRALVGLGQQAFGRGQSELAKEVALEASGVAGKIGDQLWGSRAISAVSQLLAVTGETDLAIRHTRSVVDPSGRAEALADLAHFVARDDKAFELGIDLARESEATARAVSKPTPRPFLPLISTTAAEIERFDEALILASMIDDEVEMFRVLVKIAASASGVEDARHGLEAIRRADCIELDTRFVPEPVTMLVAIATVASELGEGAIARRRIAEAIARTQELLSGRNPYELAGALEALTTVAPSEAAGLARSLGPDTDAVLMMRLVRLALKTGDIELARSWALRLEDAARCLREPLKQSSAIQLAAGAAAAVGQVQHAMELAMSAQDATQRLTSLAFVAKFSNQDARDTLTPAIARQFDEFLVEQRKTQEDALDRGIPESNLKDVGYDLANAHLFDQAVTVASYITDLLDRAGLLAHIAEVAAADARSEIALQAAHDAASVSDRLAGYPRDWVGIKVVNALVSSGDFDSARNLALTLDDAGLRAAALSDLVKCLLKRDAFDDASELAAAALRSGHWSRSLPAWARTSPPAFDLLMSQMIAPEIPASAPGG